jgi:hypothetical protein
MSALFRVTADHLGFYREKAALFSKIQSAPYPLREWTDVVSLKLPASLRDDLDWSEEKRTAECIIKSKKWILWEIDFQFQLHKLPPFDTSAFFAYARALEEFVKWSCLFSEQTFGVCLYRGGIDFFSFFDHRWEEMFFEWLDELVQAAYAGHELKNSLQQKKEGEWIHTDLGQHYFHLFAADTFAAYLHRLASFLPDGTVPFAFFDARTLDSPAYTAQLFSKERFKHLYLGVNDWEFSFVDGEIPALAICLPSDPYCDRRIAAELDRVMKELYSKATPFRIICEENLTEEWDGLDQLIIIPESISPRGKRKLQGFAAAGGEIKQL